MTGRLDQLGARMDGQWGTVPVFASVHNIAHYSEFPYCAFGRPCGLVVTEDACVTIPEGSVRADLGDAATRGCRWLCDSRRHPRD